MYLFLNSCRLVAVILLINEAVHGGMKHEIFLFLCVSIPRTQLRLNRGEKETLAQQQTFPRLIKGE